jgi:hypothetical protein
MCSKFKFYDTVRESKIFSSLLRKQNLVSSRGFVKISARIFGAHMKQFDISLGFMVSQEMMSNVNVFGSRVLHMIVCKFYGTLIVTQ